MQDQTYDTKNRRAPRRVHRRLTTPTERKLIMETGNNAQTAINLLASDPTILGCTWDERGITPIRGTSAAPAQGRV